MTLRERLSAADEARGPGAAAPEPANHAYQDLKKNMHQMILDRIDLERLKRLTAEQFKHELALLIQRIIEEERIVLNQQERHNLVLDIQHEMLGFGPLEPLLGDPTVSDILVNTHAKVYVERRGRLELTGVTFHDNKRARWSMLACRTARASTRSSRRWRSTGRSCRSGASRPIR